MATRVRIETSLGNVVIELFESECPITTANFLGYVKSGFYDGTIFHRVIPGFMAQGGGMLPGMKEKENGDPIKNEAKGAPTNARGTVAMARTSVPDSATSQFFINFKDNKFLDYSGPGPGAGYCAFGTVVEGMETVDAMAKIPTGRRGFHDDVPKDDIVIVKASLV